MSNFIDIDEYKGYDVVKSEKGNSYVLVPFDDYCEDLMMAGENTAYRKLIEKLLEKI